MKKRGFTIRQVGIGDGIQFTSLPENYYRATGQKLVDVTRPWYFDHNPYVDRESKVENPVELWNYPTQYPWPHVRDSVYMSNAEIHASVFGVKLTPLRRPRLYRYEEFPFEKRELILFHTQGKSHGKLPEIVIDHVVKKYEPTGNLFHIGDPLQSPISGLRHIETPTLWDLARLISQAAMLIGPDSGPSWIAACYPDVVVKKVRTKFQFGYCKPENWVPLDVRNSHSFWDDQGIFQIYNCTEDDVGFTHSYKRL